MENPGTFWTAMAALVISLASGALAFFEAMQGPQVRALPIEDVFLFHGGPDRPMLAAVARAEIANSAARYPDILLSQAIVVVAGDEERACLSARGQARYHGAAGAAAAAIDVSEAAELIEVNRRMSLEVRDVSPRASLPAGELYSMRQLFDQAATNSEINACRQHHRAAQERRLTATEFVEAFRGQTVLLRYEARFESDPGYVVECEFELTPLRAERLLDENRRSINVPCAGAAPREMASERGLWQRISAAFDRLF